MDSSFEQDCKTYFAKAKTARKVKTNADAKEIFIKAFARSNIDREIIFVGNRLKVLGNTLLPNLP